MCFVTEGKITRARGAEVAESESRLDKSCGLSYDVIEVALIDGNA